LWQTPVVGRAAHGALEPINMFATSSSCAGSSNMPSGNQDSEPSPMGFGTGEPHPVQKYERKPVFRSCLPSRSWPLSQMMLFVLTMVAAFDAPPLCLRHSEQWH
jgi:hypothetical protein